MEGLTRMEQQQKKSHQIIFHSRNRTIKKMSLSETFLFFFKINVQVKKLN